MGPEIIGWKYSYFATRIRDNDDFPDVQLILAVGVVFMISIWPYVRQKCEHFGSVYVTSKTRNLAWQDFLALIYSKWMAFECLEYQAYWQIDNQ